MTTEPDAEPDTIIGQVRREALQETLAGIAATVTADVASAGGRQAVETAVNDHDHRLRQAIADRDLAATADPETLTRIEQRWGLTSRPPWTGATR